jgi:SAM-dependent methyltransferase
MSRHDVFNSGSAYEAYVGRWSRRLAPLFVEWLGVPAGGRWLDVGCGTGALTTAVLERSDPVAVTGIDLSPALVKHATAAISDPRASFSVGSAMALQFSDATFDAVASALVLNFVPDPLHAASEMSRVVRPGGAAGAYVWDYVEGMRMMRVFWDAAIDLNPAAAELDEGPRFPICRPLQLRACFEAAGLEEVEVRPLDLEMVFADFDDYWSPFLGGQGPAPAYAMSLGETDRARLRDLIRSRLPFGEDGSVRLTSRAWAVRGSRAGRGEIEPPRPTSAVNAGRNAP